MTRRPYHDEAARAERMAAVRARQALVARVVRELVLGGLLPGDAPTPPLGTASRLRLVGNTWKLDGEEPT